MIEVIVGLGNPGPQYERTRHNIGFSVVDQFVYRCAGSWKQDNDKAFSEVVTGQSKKRLYIVKPLTFMNKSGEPLAAFCQQKGVKDTKSILVVHDELDLELGVLKLKSSGGEGGHNGLKSISACFGNQDYIRLRFGIGRPIDSRFEISRYVLSSFLKEESEIVKSRTDKSVEVIQKVLDNGVALVQNELHRELG